METTQTYHESEDGKTIELNLTLTRDEWERFVHLLGLAAGVMGREDMTVLFWDCLRLVNKIMEGNPNWVPYWIPEAER